MTFVIAGLRIPGLTDRQHTIAGFGWLYAVVLLPFVSILLAKGVGVHDCVSNVRVVRALSNVVSTRTLKSGRARVNYRWSPKQFAVLCLTWTATTTAVLLTEGNYGGVGYIRSVFRDFDHYFDYALKSHESPSATLGQVILQAGMGVSDIYWGGTPGVLLLGNTQHLLFPVDATSIKDRDFALEEAVRRANAVLHDVPPTTQWLDIALVSNRQFGFVNRGTAVRILANMKTKRAYFAPREPYGTPANKSVGEFTDTILGKLKDSVGLVEVVLNRFHLEKFVSLASGHWHPFSVDFLSRREPSWDRSTNFALPRDGSQR
jgi:hypothetical protein